MFGVGGRSDRLGRYGSGALGGVMPAVDCPVVGVVLPAEGCPVVGSVLPADGCPVVGVVLLAEGCPVGDGSPGVRLLLADRGPVIEVAVSGGLVRAAAAVPRRPGVPVGMDEDTGFNERVGANRPITEEPRAPDSVRWLPLRSPAPSAPLRVVVPAPVVLLAVAAPASPAAPAAAVLRAPAPDPRGGVAEVRLLGAASWAALEASRAA